MTQTKLRHFFFAALSLAVLSVVATSCKKDKQASTADKMVGTWNIQRVDFVTAFEGNSDTVTEDFEPGSTIEFKSNGVVVATSDSTYTGTWKVQNEKLVLKDITDMEPPEGYEIKKLTASELQLYAKQEMGGGNYYEIKIFLIK